MSIVYKIPEKFCYRLHHIKPRFKGDIENVLFFMAKEIARIGELPFSEFNEKLNESIKIFNENICLTKKTIDNWRTEISSLFGLVISNEKGTYSPSPLCLKLANTEDLIHFFRNFLYFFQYPGGHLKPQKVKEMIEKGIKFKPAPYILNLLLKAEKSGTRFGIRSEEATYLIFNDLRVTRGDKQPKDVLVSIEENRKNNIKYNSDGDSKRYAQDILDYLVLANFLEKKPNRLYYLKKSEKHNAAEFSKNRNMFSGYKNLYGSSLITIDDIRNIRPEWFKYVNSDTELEAFNTNINSIIDDNQTNSDFQDLLNTISGLRTGEDISTHAIGNVGESLAYGHERAFLKEKEREDLIHLVKRIPTPLAMGFDILSRDENGKPKNIEVKTTISKSSLTTNRFHLSPNEWNIAQDTGELYYVYRIMISSEDIKLFIIQNPVSKYKNGKLEMYIRDGAEITFNNDSGHWENLRIWKN